MKQNYETLSIDDKQKILDSIQCFILDMDGTIYLGDRLFDFTIPFLEKLTTSGKDFYFYTNTKCLCHGNAFARGSIYFKWHLTTR